MTKIKSIQKLKHFNFEIFRFNALKIKQNKIYSARILECYIFEEFVL